MGKMLTGKKVKCGKGQIKIQREGYTRDAYTREDGTRVKRTRVPATTFCIDDPGKPGRTSRGAEKGPYSDEEPWITREGKLGGPGFTDRPQKERRKILDKCVKQYGYRSCLGSVMVLLRNTEIHKDTRKKLTSDKNWLVKKYGGPGSFSENPEENPCCDSCAVGNPCESGCPAYGRGYGRGMGYGPGPGYGHGRGCPCPDCRWRNSNPAPANTKQLKSKLLR